MASIEELQAEVRALRDELVRMSERVSSAAPAREPEARILSRRNLLRAAPAVVAGGAIAAMSASPAAANVGDPVLLGKTNAAGAGKTTTVTGGTPWVLGGVDPSAKVAMECDGGLETDWLRSSGVEIGTHENAALYVNAPYMSGYAATFVGAPDPQTDETLGVDVVLIEGIAPAVGLSIFVADGPDEGPGYPATTGTGMVIETGGVAAELNTSGHAQALRVTSSSTSTDKAAAWIVYAGKGRALYVEATAIDNANGAVTGVSHGNGVGVMGENTSTDQSGIGVVGTAGVYGRGAELSGGAAALRLVPSTAKTHPTNGKVGDLFVDSDARLWFCQKSEVGAIQATWVKVV